MSEEIEVRKWALNLVCTADLRLGGRDVLSVAAEFADYIMTGKLPAHCVPDAAPQTKAEPKKRWFA